MGRPARTDENFPNRIRELRLLRGLTLEQLAEKVGLTKSALGRLETGDSQLKFLHLRPLALALAVDEPEILFDLGNRPIPLVGFVRIGGRVDVVDSADRLQIECPRGLNPSETDALLVSGDALAPIEPGAVLFVGRAAAAGDYAIGKLAVVELADGERLVRQVRRGYTIGRYNLISGGAAPIEDAEIRSIARILMIGAEDTFGLSRVKAHSDAPQAEVQEMPRPRARKA